MAAIRAVTVASISGVVVGVAVGSAAATAACTITSKYGVAVGMAVEIGGGGSPRGAGDRPVTVRLPPPTRPKCSHAIALGSQQSKQSPNPPSPNSDDFTSYSLALPSVYRLTSEAIMTC